MGKCIHDIELTECCRSCKFEADIGEADQATRILSAENEQGYVVLLPD